ncbi:YoaK family protein [Tardiphaga sp. 367_B4_N1_1]|uniref:YoaK family protein n=1 Tax=unclassified Tardiphaga TaxID=2631404 RepID=UPI003F259865
MNPFLFDVSIIFIAGFLDAVGVTFLSGIFVSFMSGNSINLGITVAHGRTAAVIPIVSAIASFVLGAFIGSLIAQRRTLATTIVLMSEVAMIVLSIAILGTVNGFIALLPVCIAMGMQNAIPRSVSGVAIGRSFVTGELFGVGHSMAMALRDRNQLRQAAVHGASWLTIVLGAISGAASLARFGLTPCLGASAIALFIVMAIDRVAQFAALGGTAKLPP